MEARPALSIQRSGASQLINNGVSGGLSSSLPILSTHLEETYEKFPDTQQAHAERELMTRSLFHTTRLPTSNGVVGHIFSSSSGVSSDIHYTSALPNEKHSRNSPFISESPPNTAALPLAQSLNSLLPQSTIPSQCNKENSGSWCTDTDFLDFPERADQLITGDDALASNWNELLADNVTNLEPKTTYQVEKPCTTGPAQNQQLPSPSVESQSVVNPSSSVNNSPAKSRMRWTPELHEAFVEAVNQLGGSESVLHSFLMKLITKVIRVMLCFDLFGIFNLQAGI
ncbi:protein PHOSPHATE STARVATION RESPONSE 1-like isoform X1 [Hibiscus syriacus]|uniref:protein PHOSPHATE STARVATION RESPONSE 1-like isoform X1 n=1 Tax=Hibiscus syriacus TaxID=106335 RepID=UPI001921C7A4|nr:protein PHOSPHATE STARVATION RESPONSE 1-like isoform X1 [Hibiscus syriacus]